MFKYKLIEMKQKHLPYYIEFGFKQQPCVLYGFHDKPFVFVCEEEMCDFDFINKNNITYQKIPKAKGSTIVCSEGDIAMGIFGAKDFCLEMQYRIVDKFSKMLTNGELVNNDLMYNGNKYGALTHIQVGDIYYLGIHISNNIDKELIQNICKKKMYKIPEKLPIQITKKDILEIFSDCDGGSIDYENYC